ncbi:MAG: cation-translocating P-type ATPase, partial [Bilifractor sp.]
DKTGTLTQNKMTVQDIYIGGEVLSIQQIDPGLQLHRYLLYDAVLTNDSSLVDGKGIGDPTEYALLEMYQKIADSAFAKDHESLTAEDLRHILGRIQEVPFDSDRKLMSTKHLIHDVPTVFTKGAVDVLLERCDRIRFRDQDGSPVVCPMTDTDRQNILEQNQKFSERGLRVLAFAYKETEEELSAETENHFTFLGLVSEMDPPRAESAEAVRKAAAAGIRTVMITGDHKVTAQAIARQIGIFQDGDLAVTGMELDAMSEEELEEKVEKISVYARVSPENKIRIVKAWQKKGRIVSMTGDGVNDAPALKQADIGVAMGITGTEVSKDAASMILTDDNFATIIQAVANGRTVYENIRNAVLYLLSGNLSAIITVIFASLAGMPVPFLAVQLLFINLVTDSLPALAIGMEPEHGNILHRKPRDPKANLMDKAFIRRMTTQGALIAAVVIAAFLQGLDFSSGMACTMAFSTLTLARLLHGFNCRGTESLAELGFRRNPYSLGAFAIGFVLVLLALFTGFGRSLFSVLPMSGLQFLTIVVLAAIPTLVIQVIRMVRGKLKK